MAGFIYFIPCARRTADSQLLMDVGLGYALGAHGVTSLHTFSGPGGAEGLLVSINRPDGADLMPSYRPKAQSWKAAKGGKFWVGLATDEYRPKPGDLVRAKVIAGEAVKLRDGSEWTVPIARSIVRGSTLPKELVLGEDGESWEPRELPEFVGLCQEAEKAFELLAGGKADEEGNVSVNIPYKDGMRIAVTALGVNYRVGPLEVSMLRLCSDDEMVAVLRALCDLNMVAKVLEDREKKELTSASSPIGGGPADNSPATSPVSGI